MRIPLNKDDCCTCNWYCSWSDGIQLQAESERDVINDAEFWPRCLPRAEVPRRDGRWQSTSSRTAVLWKPGLVCPDLNPLFFVLCRGYTHRFSRPRCCPTSPSFLKTSSEKVGRNVHAHFFLIFSDEVFCLSAKRCPPELRLRKSSDVSSDFFVREARTTPRTRKSCV